MKKFFKYFAIFLLCLAVYNVISLFHKAEPISGVVLDATTGKPIEGAVVVATWYSQKPGFHTPGNEYFESQEVLTDSHGRYTIPGWEMRFLKRFHGSFSTNTPDLYAYKYTYLPKRIENRYERPTLNREWKDTHDFSILWYGPTEINLSLLVGTEKEKIELFDSVQSFGFNIWNGCLWKKSFNLILEMDKQFEDRENYFANMYKDKKDVPQFSDQLYTPWYLHQVYPPSPPDCPEIIEILTNARKLRHKD